VSLRLQQKMEKAGREGRAALCFSAEAAEGGTHHQPSYTFAVPVTLGAKSFASGKQRLAVQMGIINSHFPGTEKVGTRPHPAACSFLCLLA